MGQIEAVPQCLDFVEKINFFSREFLKLCTYLHEGQPARETFTKRLYALMVSSSKLLEDFLDFHGAKNSSEWYYYRELVSSVRNLGRRLGWAKPAGPATNGQNRSMVRRARPPMVATSTRPPAGQSALRSS